MELLKQKINEIKHLASKRGLSILNFRHGNTLKESKPANHRITTNIQRRIYGHATNVEARPLNEEKTVQAATDLIRELFIFLVAGSALIFEVQRSAISEARKEKAHKQEIEAMKHREEDLAKKKKWSFSSRRLMR
ncbi:hypothetical protein IEQ34_017978 [Dendrobium chrysotoxum]|uniref:Uncharacterized protein n=1 Tax=Dendrobium chrysotoxum TaxID=161865 RepID=A0AAV7GCR0_DENCH|nr:hypothetical protein IEQ34_017978 [Dendrobium chrysotoxum]